MTQSENQKTGKIEKIGKVTLDYSLYPGQDFYCDGTVELELLEIVGKNRPEEFERIIRERKDWPTLYHLSSVRGNIVNWIPFTGREKVLEIGAGPGAVTSAIAPKVREVTCVELSALRSAINAHRNKEQDNITIRVGNFEDIEPTLDRDYDYIFLIGVFEYSALYIHDRNPFHEELSRILKHLGPDGRLILAIENRLGMKYFAGCREDHTGRYFDGIEGYPGGPGIVRTFSRKGLEEIFRDCGVSRYDFYYPYPDYKFPEVLFSDERLPGQGELTANIRNFDRDRLLLFDEGKAFDAVLREKEFPVFANSYLIVIGPSLPVRYCKFSGERKKSCRIRTELCLDEGGRKVIRKLPMGPEAVGHLRGMQKIGELLTKRYEGGKLKIASCRWNEKEQALEFEFAAGNSLEELLDERLRQSDMDSFIGLIREYRSRLSWHEDFPAGDIDMIFQNILVDPEEEDRWTAIDYEWGKAQAVPSRDNLKRALECYFRGDETRREYLEEKMTWEQFCTALDLNPEEMRLQLEQEDRFQEEITGGCTALGELRFDIGGKVIVPAELSVERAAAGAGSKAAVNLATVQIYYDRGNGFNEQDSCFLDQNYREEGRITFEVPVDENIRGLRIDPALCPCVTVLTGVSDKITGKDLTGLFAAQAAANGAKSGANTWIFATHDPGFSWNMKKIRRKAGLKGKAELIVSLQMSGLPATMAGAMELRK